MSNSKNPTNNDEVSARARDEAIIARLEALEERMNKLDGHIHLSENDIFYEDRTETSAPYIEAVNNEGQDVWRPL
jgi:hypothetical protein